MKNDLSAALKVRYFQKKCNARDEIDGFDTDPNIVFEIDPSDTSSQPAQNISSSPSNYHTQPAQNENNSPTDTTAQSAQNVSPSPSNHHTQPAQNEAESPILQQD
ncbi:hypothetical protein BpHYR1_020776 [Brachionus plicatilis]|uniref:Uncharacterized protein n=1 Tax=Brachionus plicatilis TaxID=10195 RepID=A0A3M7SGB0_BRAPC|nr:hypothetical protein BpHYR1_020776 [Brachionus plicatilis]